MLQPACATRVMRPLRAHLTEDCTGVQVDQLLAPQFREDVVRLEQHVGRKAEAGRQTVPCFCHPVRQGAADTSPGSAVAAWTRLSACPAAKRLCQQPSARPGGLV